MKTTRERKILIALLGVGLGALTFDRLVLESSVSGPAAAAAAQAEVSDGKSAVGSFDSMRRDADLWSTGAMAGTDSLANRIAKAAAEAGVKPDALPDAFAMPAKWSDLTAGTSNGVKGTDAEAVVLTAEQFENQHRLMAVMGRGDHAIAMIDGQALRIGQQLDGYTLIEAQQRIAVFTAGAQRAALRMAVR